MSTKENLARLGAIAGGAVVGYGIREVLNDVSQNSSDPKEIRQLRSLLDTQSTEIANLNIGSTLQARRADLGILPTNTPIGIQLTNLPESTLNSVRVYPTSTERVVSLAQTPTRTPSLTPTVTPIDTETPEVTLTIGPMWTMPATLTATTTPREDLGILPTAIAEGIPMSLILSVEPGNADVRDSVVPGGIRVSTENMTAQEAIMASFVVNGNNSGNQNFENGRLNLARAALVRMGLPADFRIDIPNLRQVQAQSGRAITIDGVEFTTLGTTGYGGDFGNYSFALYKARADVRTWGQIAITGSGSNINDYISRGTLIDGELVDVFEITDLSGNQIFKGSIRDLCANTMGQEIQASIGNTPTPVPTATEIPATVVTQPTSKSSEVPTNTAQPTPTPRNTITVTIPSTETAVPTNPHTAVVTQTQPPSTETAVPPVSTSTSTTVPPTPVPTNTDSVVPPETPNPPTETSVPIGINIDGENLDVPVSLVEIVGAPENQDMFSGYSLENSVSGGIVGVFPALMLFARLGADKFKRHNLNKRRVK